MQYAHKLSKRLKNPQMLLLIAMATIHAIMNKWSKEKIDYHYEILEAPFDYLVSVF